MAYNPMPPLLRRWLAGVLAVLIGLGPLASPLYAGPIPLADEPLNVKNSAQPNIILTVDDSTSMLFDFLPDYVAQNYCRDGTGRMNAPCGSVGAASDFTFVGGGKYFSPGYTFQQYNLPYSSYTGAYDASGPGAGCFGGSPPTCAPGVNPGSLPGLSQYPAGPQPSWPHSLQPYEYWLLWPAPPHSAGLNALYYDPRLTYDPPVDSTGASYPSMTSGNTSGWTKVQADPWQTPPPAAVDLTASVTDGLWCDSDWTLGSPTDRTKCRYNGTNAVAFNNGNGAVSTPEGQDYTYPWAPPGFVVSASAGSTTAQTYAAQKVKMTSAANPTDPNYTKYGALFGEQVNDGTNGTPNNWNATTKNQHFFYENENIIWCDPTSPSWPQTGPTQSQFCGNVKLQACSAQAQTCCKDPGNCSGNPTGASCGGLVQGTCNSPGCAGTAGTCNGFNAGACNFGTCGNKSAQICNGTNQTCTGIGSQTCNGVQNQTCQLPGTQSCQPPVCSVTYTPAGCNLLPPDPENPCQAVSSCAPPVCTNNPGTCSITKAACGGGNTSQSDADKQCPQQPGACSASGRTCFQNSDCTNVGHCSIDTGTVCSVNSDCPIKNGTCSKTPTVACTNNTDCPGAGTCSNKPALVCLFDTDCGQCNNPAGKACTSAAQCTTTQGTCNQKLCSDGVTPCASNAQCGGAKGTCNTVSCSSAADCPVSGGKCNLGNAACTVNSQCPGQCSKSNGQPWSQKACQTAADCRTNGTCAAPSPAGTACTTACTNIQWDNNAIDQSCGCKATFGTCKGSKLNPPPACFATACNQGQDQFCCSNIQTCSQTHGACQGAGGNCPNVQGVCSVTGGACDCATAQIDCGNKVTNITSTCTVAQLNAECPPVGKCTITGQQCTSDASCPAQPGPLPPSAAVCSTGGVGGVATATLRNDAENNGVVCRRNNKTSGAYTSGPFDFPSGKFLTPITNGTGADACPATDHYASTPRHYWKSEVQWCDKAISAAGDKWLGFGTDAGGTCQAGKDSTHIYPRFFQFGAANYVDNYANAAFQRVDLDITKINTATYTHTWVDSTGQTQTITRTFAQEMTNYANWFAYYRTRVQAVKTVTSLTFTALDDQYRVGFHTLSNGLTTNSSCGAQSDPATFVDIANFTPAQKSAWWAQLFGITIPLCLETPTLDAMARIGDYFLNGTSPVLTGSTDPIILSCQKNWHMLFTDGFTNQAGLPGTKVADQDDTVPTLPDPVTGLTTGSPWPHPFREDPTAGASNAASDYAMNYWVTDLRPSGALSQDNVPGTTKDPATWQHLNFAAMSLGTQGKLPVANQSVTENLLAAGTLQWPQPYPNVWKPDNSGVDDLWHAAINGRGRFVNAGSAAELKLGMGQILQDITNQAGSRAGVGLASSSISLANHAVYRVTFQPGWAGTLTKIDIDVVTGAELSNLWEAAEQLHNQLNITASDPTCATAGSCPWFTNRKIFTVNDQTNTAVPFLWGSISSAQQDSLAPGLPAVGQAVLEYLRGNPVNEGVSLGQFRVRATATFGENFLGDIVDSQAVYVGAPNAPYLDANDPGYSSFVSAQSARPARVYLGANDGMAHAFDDASGQETWAFVPKDLYRPDNTGLGALAYQDGALPPFRHHYYVDSTPRIIDVDYGGQDWHSLMVGGLGKGGKSYYAIDVTTPGSVTTEAAAASTYRWTFTDADMGYTYGRPMLAKTRATGDMWLMVVSAGYNNPSGVGKIFLVDAKTGGKLFNKVLTTGFGNSNAPSGLVHIAGYTQDFRNQLIDQIYGGDLYGNLWRFDVSDPNPANWDAAVGLFATLTAPDGSAQPITTPPQIEVDLQNSVDRWVFIGTGRLLDDSDLSDPTIANQTQTFYAIRDGTTTTPKPLANLKRADLVPLVDKVNGLSSKPVNGWYDDLDGTRQGQRIITPVQAALSVVAYAGTSPQDNPCLTGEPATLYVREFSLGESLLSDAGGNPVEGIGEVQGAVGLDIAIFADASGPNSASGVDIRVAVTAGTTGDVVFQHIKPPSFLSAHRMSWRLLGQ